MRSLFAIPVLLLFTIAFASVVQARVATDGVQIAAIGDVDPSTRVPSDRPDPVVKRIQKQLSVIGIYQGPVDGRMGPNVEQAIRLFQQSRGLKVDGLPSEDLANTLETDEKVNDLLKRLETVRNKKIEAARQALMADPRTRRLLDDEARSEVANPTRDPEPCFKNPTPRCLLQEAVESAKAIFKDELRDWAFGEILAAQARAGLADEATTTARRIADPRLVMVALREISVALARGGESDGAMKAADIIPDTEKKLEAFATIAQILAGQGESERLAAVVKRVDILLKPMGGEVQSRYYARFAVLFHSLRNFAAARRYLDKVAKIADKLRGSAERNAALRHLAIARAEMADPDGARAVLKKVDGDSDRIPILSSLAQAQARNGAIDKALAAAAEIPVERYRAVALSDVAGVLAHNGDVKRANAAIEQARALASEIKLPYARSFAASRVAMALIDLATASGGAFDAAIKAADVIEDNTLRAYTLWAVATEQRRAGEPEAAKRTEILAREAVGTIKSRLSQVWLYADLASSFADAWEKEPAWTAFRDGLDIAHDVTNAWGRARALAKLANALSAMTEPEPETTQPPAVQIPAYLVPNGNPTPPDGPPPPQ